MKRISQLAVLILVVMVLAFGTLGCSTLPDDTATQEVDTAPITETEDEAEEPGPVESNEVTVDIEP